MEVSGIFLQAELDDARGKLDGSVARERFDSVCAELEAVLRREQQAQLQLRDQAMQLEAYARRVDVSAEKRDMSDGTIADVVQVSVIFTAILLGYDFHFTLRLRNPGAFFFSTSPEHVYYI